MRFILRFDCLAIVVGGVLALAGCGTHEAVGVGCELSSGDLAVSEIMANPQEDDTGREWFEIYNTTSSEQILDRLVIKRLSLQPDGSVDFVDHSLRPLGGTAIKVAAKSYFVLGDGVVGVAPIDYSYGVAGESFGALNNTQGGIGLACQGRAIDEVWYGTTAGAPEPVEGKSLTFDGGVAPDQFLNDRGDWWCNANGERYDGVNSGTPGEANDFCGFATCDQGGGVMRDVVPPKAGELVVSEVFADAVGADDAKEWIEVYVAATHAVDLNGLLVTDSTTTGSSHTYQITSLQCVSADPGTYVVIGSTTDRGLNGNVPVVAVADGMTLYSTAGTLDLIHGRTLIDRAAIPAAKEAVSSSLDPLKLTATGNDDAASFCLSNTTGLFAGTGTPGSTNDLCPGECRDAGVVRRTLVPTTGSLVVTEVYPNPAGADNYREWVEVYVAGGPVDFNDLSLVNTTINTTVTPPTTSTSTAKIADSDCLSFPQGAYVVVGGANAAASDQVSVEITIPGLTAGTGLVLANSSAGATTSSVALEVGSTVIDSMSYSLPAQEGKSFALKPTVLDATQNDDPANWCWSSVAHLPFTGVGSPGITNDPCP